jgi:hypothetical protein
MLLGSSNVNFSLLQGISETKWLPTNLGLCSADGCRHAAPTPSALFHKVPAILEPVTILPSFQSALHWVKPLPIDLLIRQLDRLLDSEVVKEFGPREWSDEKLESLG